MQPQRASPGAQALTVHSRVRDAAQGHTLALSSNHPRVTLYSPLLCGGELRKIKKDFNEMNQNTDSKSGPADSQETTFTPSELVLLHGEQFSPKGKLLDRTKLIHNGQEVVCSTLVERVMAAAVLGNEQYGVIRLEIRQKRGLLGLGKVDALYMEPSGQSFNWPAGTLEAEICRRVPALKANKNRHEVYNFVYEWMGREVSNPWDEVIAMLQRGLGQRGLLDTEEKKVLFVFTSKSFSFPQRTADLLAKEDIRPIQQALDDCERSRPQVWKMLLNQIGKAVRARTEQADSSIDE